MDAPGLTAVIGDRAIPLALPTEDALDDVALDAIESLIGLLAPLAPPWLSSTVGLLGWASGVDARPAPARWPRRQQRRSRPHSSARG